MRNLLPAMLRGARVSLLAVYSITVVALLYAITATTLYLAYRAEFYEVLDDVKRVLDYPAIKPLA